MDHIRILRRALDITRAYRALWVFGILLALTASRGGGNSPGGGGGGNGSNGANGGDFRWPDRFPDLQWPFIPNAEWNSIIGIVIAVLCVVVLLAIAFTILRYVSLTALVRMGDRYEATGEKVTVREGFRLGWDRRSLRTWLVDLLFGVTAFVAFMLLLGLAAAPLLLWTTQNETLGIIGTIATVGLAVMVIFFIIIVAILLNLLGEFFRRAIILEDLGVMDGIRRGFTVARRRVGDVIVMALILFGINLGIGIVSFLIAIPLLLVSGIAGGIPGLLAGLISSAFIQGETPALIGVLVGLPIFLVVFILPMLFIGGLVETFFTNTWTLAYRELTVLGNGVVVKPDVPVIPPAEPPAEPAEE